MCVLFVCADCDCLRVRRVWLHTCACVRACVRGALRISLLRSWRVVWLRYRSALAARAWTPEQDSSQQPHLPPTRLQHLRGGARARVCARARVHACARSSVHAYIVEALDLLAAVGEHRGLPAEVGQMEDLVAAHVWLTPLIVQVRQCI